MRTTTGLYPLIQNSLAASRARPYLPGMRPVLAVPAAAVLALAAACGGSGGGLPVTPPAPVLSLGGSYQITPTLIANGCGEVQVLPGPATVAHTPGATTLSLSHVGQTYSGTVDSRGAFQTAPRAITVGSSTDTVAISGTFTTTGFDATVTVDAAHAGVQPCAYSVRWLAAKQGTPNVIP